MNKNITVREEAAADKVAVRRVNLAAFDTPGEADLVDALRQHAEPVISRVAEVNGQIVGHILFSPVTIERAIDLTLMGLAPMAVLPDWQRQGVGSALVSDGLQACRERGVEAVVVLGHPSYYPRFGFVPSIKFDIRCEYDVPDEAFMACELVEGCLQATSGVVKYHPAFATV